jgi:hypothetical protein
VWRAASGSFFLLPLILVNLKFLLMMSERGVFIIITIQEGRSLYRLANIIHRRHLFHNIISGCWLIHDAHERGVHSWSYEEGSDKQSTYSDIATTTTAINFCYIMKMQYICHIYDGQLSRTTISLWCRQVFFNRYNDHPPP